MASSIQGSSNLAGQNSNSSLGYEVSLQMVMVYNPKLEPPNKKPSEEDIQDAKLIYYYPDKTAIEEKRNHVGLAEGNFQFWNSFINEDDEEEIPPSQIPDLLDDEQLATSNSNSVPPPAATKKPFQPKKNVQVTVMDKYIHVQEEVEEDIWIYLVLQRNPSSAINFRIRRDDEEDYYSSETNRFEESRLKEDHVILVLRHFYETFSMFFGDMAMNVNKGNKVFQQIMDQFILRYLDLNGSPNNKKLNVLRYELHGFQYAPIEKNTFLSLQSLLNIVNTIDTNVKHNLIFFGGYFIYSSLNHDQAFQIYEYFYSTEKPFEYADRKMQRFSFMQDIQESYFYGSVCNSHNLGTNIAAQRKPGQLALQKIFLRNPENGRKEEYQMNVFYEKSLMVVSLYETEHVVTTDKVVEINSAISRNSEKIAQRVDKAINEFLKKEEGFKYMYFNQMNIATKISNPITLNNFLREEVDTIISIYHALASTSVNYSSQQQLVKSTNVWIYGYKNISRIVIMLFPGTLTLPKVFDESEKLFKNYFPLLYM